MKKYLLVFGAGGALGRGALENISRGDYETIYLIDRMRDAVKTPEGKNVKIIAPADVSNEKEVEKIFARINPQKNSYYHIFSTIGGYWGGKSIAETALENWMHMINLNLNTSFLIARFFCRLMEETAGGCIVFTSALSGLNPSPGKAAYSVSKAALIFLVRSLASEGETKNFSANAVAPGILDTPENREWIENPSHLVKPSEIGETVNFIFSNFRTINGLIFPLEGR